MWYIPINEDLRSLLYAAETYEQFEGLMQFFEKLNDEEDNTLWDKLANELGSLMNRLKCSDL